MNLKYDGPLSNVAFNCNLRHSSKVVGRLRVASALASLTGQWPPKGMRSSTTTASLGPDGKPRARMSLVDAAAVIESEAELKVGWCSLIPLGYPWVISARLRQCNT